jgi:hypothetical protein
MSTAAHRCLRTTDSILRERHSSDKGAFEAPNASPLIILAAIVRLDIFTVPANMKSPVLLRGSDLGQDGAPLVPRDSYDRLDRPACSGSCAGEHAVLEALDYERLHLVVVRFDLCDRNLPGTCADGDDGRLRLVWQPMRGDAEFADAGLHAFFAIPNSQLRSAPATLRELAQLQGAPTASALAVSPACRTRANPSTQRDCEHSCARTRCANGSSASR